MRPSQELTRLRAAAQHRCRALAARLLAYAGPPTPDKDLGVALTVIDLHSLWASFARSYYISCCLRARTVGGVRLATQVPIGSIQQAIDFAVSEIKGRKPRLNAPWTPYDEPAWHNSDVLLRLAQLAGFSNLRQVQAALSTAPAAFRDLTTVRNFVAHRSQHARARVVGVQMRYLIPSSVRPVQFVRQRRPSSPNMILEEWLAEIERAIGCLCA